MSQNENFSQNDESKMKEIFLGLNSLDLGPSPYLKTRVLAHLNEGKKHRKTLLFWQFFSATSFSVMLLVGFYAFNQFKQVTTEATMNQSYVIHVDFDQNDLTSVAKAEVVLPEDVHFVSSKGKVYSHRQMKLPIQLKNAGRGKLPFVVSASMAGEKDITIRLLNEKDELVREQVLKFKFAKTDQRVSL